MHPWLCAIFSTVWLLHTINVNRANNVLRGEADGDIFNGGLGNDRLIGGSGSDFFVLNSALNAATNTDTIVNMDVMADGTRLSSTIFTQLSLGTLAGGQFRSSSISTAADANDYILFNTTSGALLYDVDGNGSGVATQFATLDTKPDLTVTNIMVMA